MSDELQRRTYRKRRRAEREALTAQRITEAAMRLHGTVGPARTTVAAIAAEAGVQRGTVYRHFPDLESLFLSCSAHWASLNPPPSPDRWVEIADPERRLRHALCELYTWYAWAEPMLTNVYRDAPLVPEIAEANRRFERHFQTLHAALLADRRVTGRARVRVAATIAHALGFPTWRSLVSEQRLGTDDAVNLMIALTNAASQRGDANAPRRIGSRPR